MSRKKSRYIQKTGKQLIRGPNIEVLIPHSFGVPFEEGLAKANSEKRVLASNKRLNQALIETLEWTRIRELFPCWSGTIVAIRNSGEMLGKEIEFENKITGFVWVFPVPKEFQNMKDAVLVAEHPDYTLEINGRYRIVRARKVDIIRNFPKTGDFYLPDPVHGIPYGEKIGPDDKRRIHLFSFGTQVTPIRRDFDFNGALSLRCISLDNQYTFCAGIAVEAPSRRI
jgi:hypothetical protein